ncbi:ROK family transcriptional regulator [Amycolatopsis suaedae]|uniref:ROK family transcriptional regulator n=1 Tax=Amycolatopsis suaedae TaxID=2510978 RepID=A0A4Q7JER1_9PSEU|nr:ROK family transcriptional regulator [Amycolatopsis suaedae]RZQ65243.1 ROK family transcriptional regulator [Amycolatopsis suaedae]
MTQPRQARQANTAAVLQLLARRGPVARSDIAKALALNHGSVGRIIEPLLTAGIVRELTEQPGRIGRPRVPVELNPSSRHAVGVHLGLERTTVGLTDLAGRCVERYAEERDPSDAAATLRRAAELAATTAASAPGPVLGVGVITGGEVDRAAGRVVRHDALGWTGVDVATPLRAGTGLDVVVDSNVRAHLGAELTFGAAPAEHSVLYLFVGNVAEMGFVATASDTIVQGTVGRILVPGLTGGHARFGECGTDRALLAAARSAGLTVTSLPDLLRLADDADPAATRLLEARSTQVALLADTLHDLTGAGLILLGGSGAPSDHWLDAVRDRAEAVPPEALVRPRSGPDSLVMAAAGLVVRGFLATGVAA